VNVLTIRQAEDLAARTLVAINREAALILWRAYPADRERVASDLAGLRGHVDPDPEWRHPGCADDGSCPDARRYSDGLLRTAALYGVAP
jgi:hypothetical protein